MYFITTKRMLEVCFSAHPNIQYRTFFLYAKLVVIPASHNSKVLFIAERRKEWREKADNRKSVRH